MKPAGSKIKNHQAIAPVLLALAQMLSVSAMAQEASPGSAATPPKVRQVLVSIPDRKLAVLEDGKVIRTFAVAVGAAASPSPTGEFQIVRRLVNPTYYHPGVVIPAGGDNPIGPRWLGLNKKGYGIHGTNDPRSIGRAASHGCIRMRNRDIVQFFSLVNVGDTVEIRGERDEQIALIFGAEATGSAILVAETTPAGADAGGEQ